MSQIGNHAFMRRFVEFLNTASPKLAAELISPHAVFHAPMSGAEFQGPDGYVEMLSHVRKSFPDVRWEVEDVVGEGNVLVARFVITGTHQGEFQGIAPTGRVVRISAMNLYRLKAGKVMREFAQFDHWSLMWQLGVYPQMSAG